MGLQGLDRNALDASGIPDRLGLMARRECRASAGGTGGVQRSPSPTSSVTIAKWHNNHAAAISLTYDDQPGADRPIDGLVARPDLNLDYEWVTQHMAGEGLPV